MKTILLLLLLAISTTSFTQTRPIEYILNGVKMSEAEFRTLNIDTLEIEKIEIIKEATATIHSCSPANGTIVITLKEPVEHTIQIIANGFESFLATQPSKEYYTKESLRNKNILMVEEWNRRYENPTQYGNIYGMRIGYDPKQDYGLDIEYQLYMFFKFMEKENNIILSTR